MTLTVAYERIPAIFIRGGTSKGVFFHERDLPASQSERDEIFVEVIGSPDPYKRQLNGMGGGISSLSKIVTISASDRPDADVNYTFGQVVVDQPVVDYVQTCGNLSSSVGPFAVDEGLIDVEDGMVTVRVFNTNTSKIFHAHFEVRDGVAVEEGDYEMSGVGGTGARITLEYLHPGGAMTGKFLPTDNPVDVIEVPGIGEVEVSIVDATNPVVFLEAARLGKLGIELPAQLEADAEFMDAMDRIRRVAGVKMGAGATPEDVPLSNPKIAILASAQDYTTISGQQFSADDYDVAVRIVSMETLHRAVTGTGGMCLACASEATGTIAARAAVGHSPGTPLRIATPSGVFDVSASVAQDDVGVWQATSVTVFRTQRRLMEGVVRRVIKAA